MMTIKQPTDQKTADGLRCHLDKLWVINAEKEFAWRRYRAEAGRNFEKLKLEVSQKHGVDIDCCRETYFTAGERIFAVVNDLLVETYSKPHRIEPWEDAQRRINGATA